MNLVINARDAMPRGGKLSIETSNVYLDEQFAKSHLPIIIGSYILLQVSDTGVGMDEHIIEQIFEPFYTTKEAGKGTGLGLATVYGIVTQSGGYIFVESQVGQGTSFNIYLPCIDSKIISGEKQIESNFISIGRGTVLIVEDEELVRQLASQMLTECGYRVIEASNGIEALAIIENREYEIDLVVTDIVMPQMGGRELAEKLTEICPQLPVLFTSGYTDDEIIRSGVIKEEINFIQKPFTFETFTRKVGEKLSDRKSG